ARPTGGFRPFSTAGFPTSTWKTAATRRTGPPKTLLKTLASRGRSPEPRFWSAFRRCAIRDRGWPQRRLAMASWHRPPNAGRGLTEVVEEKLDSRGGVAAEDLLDQVRIAAAERGQYVAVALDPACAHLRARPHGFRISRPPLLADDGQA